MFPFTRHFWLLRYAQFAYDASLQRAANMKDYTAFKYLGDQLSFSLHICCLQMLYFSGKLISNHSNLSHLRYLSLYCTFICSAEKRGCQQIELSVFSCPGLLNPSIKFLLQSSRLMVSLDILEYVAWPVKSKRSSRALALLVPFSSKETPGMSSFMGEYSGIEISSSFETGL